MSPGRADPALTRREALAASASTAAALALIACGASDEEVTTVARTETLARTPSCGDGEATSEQTEGPFFTPGSPERANLLTAGVGGTTLVLSGRVLDTDCRPITGALLDFWQADQDGVYDNTGNRLRGHQFSARDGSYRLTTIVPGLYTGRTRHIHVNAQPRGGSVLTTQLYFPDEPANESDAIFDPALLIGARASGGTVRGGFDFVL